MPGLTAHDPISQIYIFLCLTYPDFSIPYNRFNHAMSAAFLIISSLQGCCKQVPFWG